MDSEGLLRVGGRTCKSALKKNIQNPILMPRYCRITQLMIEWCHNKVSHAGRGTPINAGYWMINCNTTVRFIISKCARCKNLRGKFQHQQMADLPKDRINEEHPFSLLWNLYVWALYRQRWSQGKEKIWCIIYLPFIKSSAY